MRAKVFFIYSLGMGIGFDEVFERWCRGDCNSGSRADGLGTVVSRAFQVLSDPDKKSKYDKFGGDPDNRFGGGASSAAGGSPFSGFARSAGGPPGGGFYQEEMSPEELFRQFFGGGFGGGPFGKL